MSADAIDESVLRRLFAVGRTLLTDLRLESLPTRILVAAQELTGARHAALGIVDGQQPSRMSHLVARDEDAGRWRRLLNGPGGQRLLRSLVDDPRPLRMDDLWPVGRAGRRSPATAALLGVPILVRDAVWGGIYLAGTVDGFDRADELAMAVFADWAALAVATAQSVNESRLREAVDSAEQERRRWARELHDETLQGLAGLQVRLSIAEQQSRDVVTAHRVRDVLEDLGLEIRKLRTLITELRPAALDELGLAPALESLVEALSASSDLAIDLQVNVDGVPIDPELETAAYRLMQEALTNVIKHADARRCVAEVTCDAGELLLVVRDDGCGIDQSAREQPRGFGVTGMRERALLAGGSLALGRADSGGTELRAHLPLRSAGPRDRG